MLITQISSACLFRIIVSSGKLYLCRFRKLLPANKHNNAQIQFAVGTENGTVKGQRDGGPNLSKLLCQQFGKQELLTFRLLPIHKTSLMAPSQLNLQL